MSTDGQTDTTTDKTQTPTTQKFFKFFFLSDCRSKMFTLLIIQYVDNVCGSFQHYENELDNTKTLYNYKVNYCKYAKTNKYITTVVEIAVSAKGQTFDRALTHHHQASSASLPSRVSTLSSLLFASLLSSSLRFSLCFHRLRSSLFPFILKRSLFEKRKNWELVVALSTFRSVAVVFIRSASSFLGLFVCRFICPLPHSV